MNAQNRFTRRQFLKVTSTIAAGAPLVLRPKLFGAEQPASRVTLGFIGMGRQNRWLLSGFLKRPDIQALAVCEVDQTRRAHAQQSVEKYYAEKTGQDSFKGCAAYDDFRELLARRDIDAVVIATPDHWHATIAIAAAKAGKDVYCEKPLCQSIHEARAMVNTMRQTKRVLQTGSMQRSMPEFRVAVELIRNGVIGKISKVEVGVSGGPGVPCDLPAEPEEPGLNWDLWLGPAARRPYNSILSPRGVHDFFPQWRKYREYGGGKVTDWGAHHFDIVQWAFDMDDGGAVEFLPPSDAKAESGARFVYANGAEVIHLPGNGITFHGARGKLAVNRGNFELWIGSKQKAFSVAHIKAVAAEYLGEKAKRVYRSDDHLGNWLDCIRSRKPPVAGVEIGARAVTVCHLLNLAYYHGQRLKWNPRKEKFAGGTGNPKWLDVPYRDPWKLA